ncbi:flagellar protein FlhE [Photorhabdus luminescens]|uniref:Flagellar protein FlhE n=3 Tax=Photorhabdus TaxID=29487 RepID=A0A2S8PVX9_9GAMM|nr:MULTISPECIES: flagellar protein FlhE [Photorhabdus]OCA53476.1 Flagellar protein FlhE [Photorhabdus namnaonensis]PQQ23063.1 flagellar protein FlhE [Photorhabdus hindustanensis]QXF34047.1 flagellar protein FlhE [Photorhabdus akhurstii]UJD75865.1 flagellar protein FlhE [Photorhabdus luminescens]
MKLKKKVLTTLCSVSSALLLTMFSQSAFAANYQSSVVLPTLHYKHFTQIANVPIVGSPPATGKINLVTWAWRVDGWPKNLSVYLCQGNTNSCLDISRETSGGTTAFNNRSPAQQFLFALRVGDGNIMPIEGKTGEITVTWQ